MTRFLMQALQSLLIALSLHFSNPSLFLPVASIISRHRELSLGFNKPFTELLSFLIHFLQFSRKTSHGFFICTTEAFKCLHETRSGFLFRDVVHVTREPVACEVFADGFDDLVRDGVSREVDFADGAVVVEEVEDDESGLFG